MIIVLELLCIDSCLLYLIFVYLCEWLMFICFDCECDVLLLFICVIFCVNIN